MYAVHIYCAPLPIDLEELIILNHCMQDRLHVCTHASKGIERTHYFVSKFICLSFSLSLSLCSPKYTEKLLHDICSNQLSSARRRLSRCCRERFSNELASSFSSSFVLTDPSSSISLTRDYIMTDSLSRSSLHFASCLS